jgi:Leucine-rich repeat (LRR) protein
MKKLYTLLVLFFVGVTIQAQNITFTDANFKSKLLQANSSNFIAKNLTNTYFKIDVNDDGEIQESEALAVSYLNVNTSNIFDLTGITNFSNLLYLDVHDNQLTSINLNGLNFLTDLLCANNQFSTLTINSIQSLERLRCENNVMTTLNISNLPNLKILSCYSNQLSSLNLTSFINLQALRCQNNQITSLNITGLANIYDLDCSQNQISNLDVNNLNNLQILNCSYNQLSTLSISNLNDIQFISCYYNQLISLQLTNLPSLTGINCSYNLLSSLNFNGLSALTGLGCYFNQITTLDLNNLNSLNSLNCSDNNSLTSIFLKNGQTLTNLTFFNTPNLQYVCVDDVNFAYVQSLINTYGYVNCNLNSYCSFTPGGINYTIQGSSHYDNNNNGCDAFDFNYSNLKLSISNGTNNGIVIANETGQYSIPVQVGTHTIIPFLENPTYFVVSPSSFSIQFPGQPSPSINDFCMVSNGIHNDLEIIIEPIINARPGFDATYKVIYKNKGTSIQSGIFNLAFDDSKIDLVSAIPVNNSSGINTLTWNYTNLNPFETREVILVFNINSPTENPAVNNGDILNFTASIVGAVDDMPNDNIFTLHQTVVNSFDPNDKTCLEGTTITPNMVGDYVHYVIRFENTGTFAAQNIIVTDIIDTTKFDINTLIPLDSSHEFVTKINNEKVEFIFENINLPYDNANNDGYVAFKIKTKPTLVIGNTFTNKANIYFDYNFPVETNLVSTTVQTLSSTGFVFENYFTLAPNPAKDLLNIGAKKDIEISSISIYNTLGQLILVVTEPNNSIDVSSLKTGNYFITINSDIGTSNSKFIKM